jgi:hypothetical protein
MNLKTLWIKEKNIIFLIQANKNRLNDIIFSIEENNNFS